MCKVSGFSQQLIKKFYLIYQKLSEESDSWFPLFRSSAHTGICKKNPYRLFISQIYIIFPNKTMCKVLYFSNFSELSQESIKENIFPNFKRNFQKRNFQKGVRFSIFYWFPVFQAPSHTKSVRRIWPQR